MYFPKELFYKDVLTIEYEKNTSRILVNITPTFLEKLNNTKNVKEVVQIYKDIFKDFNPKDAIFFEEEYPLANGEEYLAIAYLTQILFDRIDLLRGEKEK